ncbi:Putidaredoxin reductase [Pandoraea terrae]|uniref:Putidaredoxin reductase n=1 Tax=Pandoraea terrae TaxID=1537710 RepID=A0A5E4RXW3_9BURK|nr:FAD-dependent oxidoreductase [Pandoraea terrae]VVD68336.1 Putidaredoxin reductase [Pandoraea terrae]
MTDVTSSTTVILGAGQAGGETALALRQQGYAGRIVVVGAENHPPYRRPPLSKAFLAGQADAASLLIRPADAYEKANIELRLGATAAGIDRAARTVTLENGETFNYDHLVLATGGRVRRLALPGGDAANVLYLRDIQDAERLRAAISPEKRVVIVGGGYIGLEVAASAVKAGAKVTVLEAAPRLLARVAEADLSAFFEALHRTNGVDIQTGVSVTGFEVAEGHVTAVVAGDRRIEADVVVVGIGLIPNTALAEAAGLPVDNGIVVDEFARTNDPAILAVGDCAHHAHPVLGRRIRLESVPSASEMAKVAASVVVGAPKPIAAAPWFWSDQFDAKLQMAGMTDGHDRVVERRLPDAPGGAAVFMLCYLREGRLVAVASVNRAQEFMAARELVGRGATIDPDKLADPGTPLKDLLAALGSAT